MIDSTKISILLCLTIIVTSILVMSYNEYVNRFSIIATHDNGIYIFDKKSTMLNKCENGKCTLMQTYFNQNPVLQMDTRQQQVQQYATNITQLPNINQQSQSQNNNNNQYNDKNNSNAQNNNEEFNSNNNNIQNKSQQTVPQVTVVNS